MVIHNPADDEGVSALRMAPHRLDNRVRVVLADEGNYLPLIGNVERVHAQYLARRSNETGNRDRRVLDRYPNICSAGDLDERRRETSAGWIS